MKLGSCTSPNACPEDTLITLVTISPSFRFILRLPSHKAVTNSRKSVHLGLHMVRF